MKELVIATRNEGKFKEIKEILSESLKGVKLLSFKDFPDAPDVHEIGETLEENAEAKALSTAVYTGRISLADDSGIFVDALGGRPGIESHRYAGPEGDGGKNNDKLLRELEGVPLKKRGAAFKCVIAVAKPSGEVVFSKGEFKGKIIFEERGKPPKGLGYTSLFVPNGYRKTVAEIWRVRKKIGHRAKALKKIIPVVKRLL